MDFVDCIPKNIINFRIILQKICTIEESDGMMSAFEMKWNPKKGTTKLPACLRGIEWER